MWTERNYGRISLIAYRIEIQGTRWTYEEISMRVFFMHRRSYGKCNRPYLSFVFSFSAAVRLEIPSKQGGDQEKMETFCQRMKIHMIFRYALKSRLKFWH